MSTPLGARRVVALVAGALALGTAAAVVAQGQFDKVKIDVQPLADHVWLLYGAGGNIGVCAGADGVVLVDDQFAPLSPKIQAAVKSLSDQPIRWIVNTHWHGDHTGGNENFANAGATILAQDNVRKRLIEGQVNKFFNRTVPPAPPKALPVVTFNDSSALHVNGEDLVIAHVAPAHTDGDAIVWFRQANVVHMGDTFFNGTYPIIDLESGGHLAGLIAACERVLPLLGPETKVIPGHGKLSDRAGLQAYHDMLVGVRDAVTKHVQAGDTLEQTQAAKPTTPWEDAWGKGFVNADTFVRMVYTDLATKR